jgi:hypothetical protein
MVYSMDDCYDDMEEPLYGFRTKVTLAENSPCTLGTTCRGSPEEQVCIVEVGVHTDAHIIVIFQLPKHLSFYYISKLMTKQTLNHCT